MTTKEAYRKSLAERLKKFRIKKGYSQEELADLLHISDRQYRRYESGEASISFDVGTALMDILEIDLDYFVAGKHSTDMYLEMGLRKMPTELLSKCVEQLAAIRKLKDATDVAKAWDIMNEIYMYAKEHQEDPPIRELKEEITLFTEYYEQQRKRLCAMPFRT